MRPVYLLMAASIGVVVYAYLLYPVLLVGIGFFRRRRPTPAIAEWPEATVTIPVYNEESHIRKTLEGLLGADYPRDHLHVLVISDASTDNTDAIVDEYADRGVKLVRLETRSGKTAAENASRKHVRGEIVVNMDATILIEPQSLKALLSQFADPTVGVVSGRDVSVAADRQNTNVGESGYVGYEMWIRDLESRVSGIVGASGCFFAVRHDLHGTIVPEALSRDFAAPLIARENGYRSVSARDAVCYVPRTDSLSREYRRKIRTMTRGLQTLFYKRKLLSPFRYGSFAWMLVSHKLMRWLVPWCAVVGFISLGVLALERRWALWLFAASALVVGVGLVARPVFRNARLPKAVALPAYLVWGLVAGIVAWVSALTGDLNPIWEPTRRGGG